MGKSVPAEVPLQSREEHQYWQQLMRELEADWQHRGLQRLWLIQRLTLSRQVSFLEQHTPGRKLFSADELERERGLRLEFLEHRFVSTMTANLNRGMLARLFSRRPLDMDRLEASYRKQGREKEFEREYDAYLHKKVSVENQDADTLFDNLERARRAFPRVRNLRRRFRKQQQKLLRKYDRYEKKLDKLPDDEIDRLIAELGDNYAYIGRSREWFREYETLVDEILLESGSNQQGANESLMRLLQQDFLTIMESRFAVFWRYFELRQFCFTHQLTDLITSISYFEAEIHEKPTSFQALFQQYRHMVQTLESAITLKGKKQSAQRSTREKLLAIDHSERLDEWATFKETYQQSGRDSAEVFNALRPVLRQCPEWQHEFRVFRSKLQVRRLSHGAATEASQVAHFVERMFERINNEIAVDVAFKTLEQEIITDNVYVRELTIARDNIKLQREQRGLNAADEINEIKQQFITDIWEKRTPSDQGASVTPLFAKNLGTGHKHSRPRSSGSN